MRVWFILTMLMLLGQNALAQPRLAVELTIGQNVGLDPYIDNVVILDGDVPVLVDELPGPGVNLGLAFVFSKFEISVDLHFYDRDTVIQHHRALAPISSARRERPNGTVDDAGVEYAAIARQTVSSPSRNNGDLLFGQVSAGYRFYVLKRDFSLFFPVVGGIGFATVLEPTRPVAFGLQAETGVSATYSVAPPIGFILDLRLGALVTPVYDNISDAARTSSVSNESTLSTILSAFVQFSASVGIQITIR